MPIWARGVMNDRGIMHDMKYLLNTLSFRLQFAYNHRYIIVLDIILISKRTKCHLNTCL